jgi:hypothetical protein
MGSMVSYKIFIQTALTAATFSLGVSSLMLATLINSKVDLSIFICSFVWMFVISSLIAILYVRKRKKTPIHYKFGTNGLSFVEFAAFN